MADVATFEPIATVSSTGASSFSFTSIPSTYTDLFITGSFGPTGGTTIRLYLNNDSTSGNYSRVYMASDGNNPASSGRNNDYIRFNAVSGISGFNSTCVLQINNYSSTNMYKTVLGRYGATNGETNAWAGLWKSTTAINRIDIVLETYGTLTGTTFNLYGITKN